MPNGTSERSALIEHCGVGGSVRKGTLYPMQYFYLGHTSGVRGYDNDVLSAEAGAYVNFEASWAPAGPRTALFAFLDAGRLTGTSSYSRRELASTGFGATWPLWKDASVTATAGFPLIRNLGAGERAGKARFDLAVTASW